MNSSHVDDGIANKSKENITLNLDEKVNKAKELKVKGNEYFKNIEYRKALRQYHNGLLYLKGLYSEDCLPFKGAFESETQVKNNTSKEEVKNMMADIHNNIAACLLKMEPIQDKRIIECCNEVVNIQPNNLKAWYRLGLCYHHMKNNEEAKEALIRANNISQGKDTAVQKLLNKVELKLKEEEKEYNNLLRNSQLKNAFIK